MTSPKAEQHPFLIKHPIPWSLTQSPLKLEPTIRDANDVTIEEIPFDFLIKCVNAGAATAEQYEALLVDRDTWQRAADYWHNRHSVALRTKSADNVFALRSALRRMADAYVRRVNTGLTAEEIAKEPWRCAEYIEAERLCRVPMKLHFTEEWLKRHVKNDPDLPCESGAATPAPMSSLTAQVLRLLDELDDDDLLPISRRHIIRTIQDLIKSTPKLQENSCPPRRCDSAGIGGELESLSPVAPAPTAALTEEDVAKLLKANLWAAYGVLGIPKAARAIVDRLAKSTPQGAKE